MAKERWPLQPRPRLFHLRQHSGCIKSESKAGFVFWSTLSLDDPWRGARSPRIKSFDEFKRRPSRVGIGTSCTYADLLYLPIRLY